MRPRNRADVPGIGHRTAIFKQANPEPVAPVRCLLDETGLAHRGKKPVNCALRPTCRLIELGERGGLGTLGEQVQKPDGLCHRMYRFAFKLCHSTGSFSFISYSVSCFRFAGKLLHSPLPKFVRVPAYLPHASAHTVQNGKTGLPLARKPGGGILKNQKMAYGISTG